MNRSGWHVFAVGRVAGFAIGLAAVLAAWPGIAHAHVAPALDSNNRYLRITPMRDRIRLAYTVYIGEVPGAQARLRMDRNRDGQLDDSESRVYADELAQQVLAGLDISMDGAPYQLSWSESHVGLGTPVTAAGSFSVDLIGWICAEDRAIHTAVIFDRFRIDRPGETEVKVNQSPGIDITRSSLGESDEAPLLELKWTGEDGPLTSRGLHIDYQVNTALAVVPPGAQCNANEVESERAEPRNWLAVWALLGLGMAALAAFICYRLARGRGRHGRRHEHPPTD